MQLSGEIWPMGFVVATNLMWIVNNEILQQREEVVAVRTQLCYPFDLIPVHFAQACHYW